MFKGVFEDLYSFLCNVERHFASLVTKKQTNNNNNNKLHLITTR